MRYLSSIFSSDDPEDPMPEGISAVKALQKAIQAGQRIYRITQDNVTGRSFKSEFGFLHRRRNQSRCPGWK